VLVAKNSISNRFTVDFDFVGLIGMENNGYLVNHFTIPPFRETFPFLAIANVNGVSGNVEAWPDLLDGILNQKDVQKWRSEISLFLDEGFYF